MLTKYYDILDVKASATEEELKQAYRKKAKQLHPDKNKAANAHEQFVLLSEAYEYLVKLKTGKLKSKSSGLTHEEWVNQELVKTRKRAAQQAKMKYQEFLNSDEYKALNSIVTIGEHLAFLFAVFMFFILPAGAIYLYGFKHHAYISLTLQILPQAGNSDTLCNTAIRIFRSNKGSAF